MAIRHNLANGNTQSWNFTIAESTRISIWLIEVLVKYFLYRAEVSLLSLDNFQSLIYCYSLLGPKVSISGKRKVIAVGSLDLSEYIKEEPASHDITVTLRPVKKSVSSGSLQFILSSIMLEDGIPRWVMSICRCILL